MMNKEQKQSYIKDMTAQFENSEAVLVTHYQGLNMKQLDDLRKHISTRRLHDAQSYAATLYEQIHQQQFAHLIPRDPDAS